MRPGSLLSLALALAGCAAAPAALPATPAAPYSPEDASLELHAHLFMKQGLGVAFRGEFNGPLAATDWSSTQTSQANPETVERSGIGVLVVSLTAYPVVSSQKDAVRRESDLARRFVREHPSWVIARDADEARAALSQGRRVIVLALERASDILETDADLDEFIDGRGIRIVTLLHMEDDENGGAAFLPGARALVNPWAAMFHSRRDPADHVLTNSHGLTEKGRALAQKLIARGVWVDVAHASDASARELVALDEAAGAPVLVSHTSLRRYLHGERGIPDWQLDAIRRTGGVVGLIPSEDMLHGTPLGPAACASDCTRRCEGGIQALAQQYAEVSARVPPASIAMGSDYSDGISHLHPGCPVGTELDGAGLWNIGQAGAVWESLEKLGSPVPRPRRRVIDHFLDAWSRVTAARAAQ